MPATLRKPDGCKKRKPVAFRNERRALQRRHAVEALDALIELITKDLKKRNNVVIAGFGMFRVSKRAARTGVPVAVSPLGNRPKKAATVTGFLFNATKAVTAVAAL